MVPRRQRRGAHLGRRAGLPNGSLYKVTGVQGDNVVTANVKYTEVASGLQEPQGVAVVDGATYITSKVGLDKLVDANGDGFFEGRQRIATWPNGNNFHEFAFGLPYKDGYFYVALSVALERSGASTRPAARSRTAAPS